MKLLFENKNPRMDNQFFTLPVHKPSVDITISNNVTKMMLELPDKIFYDLQRDEDADSVNLSWSMISDPEYVKIKEDLVRFFTKNITE